MLPHLADTLYPVYLKRCTQTPCKIFLSATDMTKRAVTRHAQAATPHEAWTTALAALDNALHTAGMEPSILRADWVVQEENTTWSDCKARIEQTRRNYFRQGVALDANWSLAFTEMELNANAMFYVASNTNSKGKFNERNAQTYCRRRFEKDWPQLTPDNPVTLFTTEGAFVTSGGEVLPITGKGLDAGRRDVSEPTPELYMQLAHGAAHYLARQCKKDGRYDYGWFSCFDRPIPIYNTLRHISTTWSLLEAYSVFKEHALRNAIVRSTDYCVKTFARRNGEATYFEDVESGELKLGSNGCALIMLTRYTELLHTRRYLPLMRSVAKGILSMQEEDGGFVHVLNSKDFSLASRHRIVYYDGEAVFGLLRLFSINKDETLLEASRRAFDHFIATDHWKNHDHWLSYSVNELTRYDPQPKYFQFGIQNFNGYLDFVRNRDTAYPTLLELMLAADEMLRRLDALPEMANLLTQIDRRDFTEALESRAHQLLNGYFWPEFAMFFKNPANIVDSFFIKHHAFRVRIDDVQHFLTGFIGYAHWLEKKQIIMNKAAPHSNENENKQYATLFFGGDVNLGRRMHWKTSCTNPLLSIHEMREADLRIINLECVISSKGSQGVEKGEGGPYYFHARPEQTNILTQAAVDVALTANNHSCDYGEEALLEQQDLLIQAGIQFAGSGKNVELASEPVFVRTNNITVAIFSIDTTMPYFAATEDTPGTWYLPPQDFDAWKKAFEHRVKAARKFANIVLIALHWGTIDSLRPSPAERHLGHLLIDLGADAVLGCHSHQLQGVEKYKNRPIIYDAGNLLFDALSTENTKAGCFLLTISEDGIEQLIFRPLIVGYGRTEYPNYRLAAINYKNFQRLCEELDTKASLTSSGEMIISFTPEKRCDHPKGIVPAEKKNSLIQKCREPLPHWIATKVPDEAAIDPVRLGPVTLLGCKFQKEYTKRQMLFVETWWRIESTERQNCSFIIHGVPPKGCQMPSFGKGMAHEGCDWMWPTTRWKPGILYREYFGLRPAPSKALVNVPVWIEISVSVQNKVYGPYRHPQPVDLHIPSSPYYRTTFPKSLEQGDPGQTWSAEQIADVTGGKWEVAPPKNWYASSVVRGHSHIKLVKGPVLFAANTNTQVAFHEEFTKPQKIVFDTHNRLKDFTSQLCGAIVDHVVEDLPKDFPQLLVDDPVRACIELGIVSRKRFTGKEIMITGSSGKTTMCSVLKHILSLHHSVFATYDNYNSRVGVPLMFASISQETEYAILEVAASALRTARGPISISLPPHLVVITSLSEAHLEIFKTLERTAKIKSKIYTGITKKGLTVINRDIPSYNIFVEEAKKNNATIYTYGTHEKSDIRLLSFDGAVMHCSIRGKEVNIPLSVRGRHMALTLCGAIACLMALGLDYTKYKERISSFTMLEGRGSVIHKSYNNKNITIIDESYNANPESMQAALETIFNDKTPSDVLILGDMLELGPTSDKYHKDLAKTIVKIEPSRLILCGSEMKSLYDVLLNEQSIHYPIKWFLNISELIQEIDQLIKDNDRILIKSSHGTGLYKLVKKLVG